ncbi:MAG: FAD-binding oxidoreductase [Dehalococcoidia bacterium]|nr:FAD-binding oxidoreductase [Dehalococcoidia bacterium]
MTQKSMASDVAIVGAGIIGTALAYFLSAEHNMRCVVLDRDTAHKTASWMAAGELSPAYRSTTPYPQPFVDFCVEGLRLHKEMYQQLVQESDVDYKLVDTPILRPAFTEAEAAEMQELGRQQRGYGMKNRWLTTSDLHAMKTWLSPDALGALLCEDEMQLETALLTAALRRACEQHGVTFRTAEVSGLRRQGGRTTGVSLSNEHLSSERVVLAMGPWARFAEKWLGFKVPVEPLRGQIVHLQIAGQLPQEAIFHMSAYVLPKPSGRVYVGTTEEYAGFDASTTKEAHDAIMESVTRLVPSLAHAKELGMTACLRPLSLDEMPIIGPVPGQQGLFLATGHARKGILLCLATGKYLAQQIAEQKPDYSLDAFSVGRIGSKS